MWLRPAAGLRVLNQLPIGSEALVWNAGTYADRGRAKTGPRITYAFGRAGLTDYACKSAVVVTSALTLTVTNGRRRSEKGAVARARSGRRWT